MPMPRTMIYIACLSIVFLIGPPIPGDTTGAANSLGLPLPSIEVSATAASRGRELEGGDASPPILLAPDAPTAGAAEASPGVARARIDPARYAAAPIDARDRRGPLWLAIVATLTLALAALSPRRPATLVAGVAIVWSLGLTVVVARRPTFDRVVGGDVDWLTARRAGTATVPIADGVAWVPVVESMRHWRSLAPRVVVVDDDRPALELSLPAAGARVAVERRRR